MKFDSRMQKALAVLASIHAAGSSADAAKPRASLWILCLSGSLIRSSETAFV